MYLNMIFKFLFIIKQGKFWLINNLISLRGAILHIEFIVKENKNNFM